jgi:hypothetical protein
MTLNDLNGLNLLWLDDVRLAPSNFHHIAINFVEAINHLIFNKIDFASLDHDLADGHYPWMWDGPYPENSEIVERSKEKTGYDVVCWMEEHNTWPPYGVRVHSQNPVGVQRMLQVIEKHYGKTFQGPIV